MSDIKVTSNALPLPLKRKQSERPASHILPLPLNRKLGTLEPIVPVVKRVMAGAVLELVSDVLSVQSVAISAQSGVPVIGLVNDYFIHALPVFTIATEFRLASLAFYSLANESKAILTDSYLLENAYRVRYDGFYLLANEHKSTITPTIGYVAYSRVKSAKLVSFKTCVSQPLQPVINFSKSLNPTQAGALIENEHGSKVQQAIPVPCRYYPIPEPPPTPVTSCVVSDPHQADWQCRSLGCGVSSRPVICLCPCCVGMIPPPTSRPIYGVILCIIPSLPRLAVLRLILSALASKPI